MKLDRNTNTDGRGKYALIRMRLLRGRILSTGFSAASGFTEAERMVSRLEELGVVDFGDTTDSEFFVIRLRDRYAAPALAAYAMAAYEDDQEYALEVLNLAKRAAEHPWKRKPD